MSTCVDKVKKKMNYTTKLDRFYHSLNSEKQTDNAYQSYYINGMAQGLRTDKDELRFILTCLGMEWEYINDMCEEGYNWEHYGFTEKLEMLLNAFDKGEDIESELKKLLEQSSICAPRCEYDYDSDPDIDILKKYVCLNEGVETNE